MSDSLGYGPPMRTCWKQYVSWRSIRIGDVLWIYLLHPMLHSDWYICVLRWLLSRRQFLQLLLLCMLLQLLWVLVLLVHYGHNSGHNCRSHHILHQEEKCSKGSKLSEHAMIKLFFYLNHSYLTYLNNKITYSKLYAKYVLYWILIKYKWSRK